MEPKKRSIEVTIIGIYFILQGWIAIGYTKQEIANQLGVTPPTISNKLKNVGKAQRKHKNGMFTVIREKL